MRKFFEKRFLDERGDFSKRNENFFGGSV